MANPFSQAPLSVVLTDKNGYVIPSAYGAAVLTEVQVSDPAPGVTQLAYAVPAGVWKIVSMRWNFQTSATVINRTMGWGFGNSFSTYAAFTQAASLFYGYRLGVGIPGSSAVANSNVGLITCPVNALVTGSPIILGLSDSISVFADNNQAGDQISSLIIRLQAAG